MKNSGIKEFEFMGVKVNNVHFDLLPEKIANAIYSRAYICLACVGTVIQATRDKALFRAMNESFLSIPDGMPLVWFGRLLGCRSIQRTPGTELFRRLLQEENGYRHFLLGDTQDTINEVIEKAKQRKENIQINGYSPPFKKQFTRIDNEKMLEKINKENPDIIWISLGGVKQEKWMYQNVQNLNRGIMIGVGAAFRFYLGRIKEPPKAFQNLGLQWFFRLMDTPVRTAKVQMKVFPKFIFNFPLEVVTERRKAKAVLRSSADLPSQHRSGC